MELLIVMAIIAGLFALVMRGTPGAPSDGLRTQLVPVASTLGLEPELTMGGRTWRAEGRVETAAGEMHLGVEHDTLLREIRVRIHYPALEAQPMVLQRLNSQAPEPTDAPATWNPLYGPVRTGDADFDRWFRIVGGASRVLAVLDAQTRRRALELSAMSELELDGGTLTWSRPASEELAGEWIREELPRMQALLEALVLPPDQFAARLIEAARHESSSTARILRLGLVRLDEAAPDSLRIEASQLARDDMDPRAKTLARQDDAVAIARIVQHAAAHPTARAAALSAIAETFAVEDALPFVAHALQSDSRVEKLAAIRAVQRPGFESLLPLLLAQVAGADADLAPRLVDAFAEIGGPQSEDGLLRLVEQKAHDVALRACDALGRCASPECIPRLEAIVERKRQDTLLPALQEVRRRIGARHGRQAGQLSLAGRASEAGALSAVEDGRASDPPAAG